MGHFARHHDTTRGTSSCLTSCATLRRMPRYEVAHTRDHVLDLPGVVVAILAMCGAIAHSKPSGHTLLFKRRVRPRFRQLVVQPARLLGLVVGVARVDSALRA